MCKKGVSPSEESAIDYFNKKGKTGVSITTLANKLAEDGHYELSLIYYTLYLMYPPMVMDASVLCNRAHVFLQMERYEEALKDINLFLGYFPDHPVAVWRRADIYSSLGRYKEAEKDYNDAKNVFNGDSAEFDEIRRAIGWNTYFALRAIGIPEIQAGYGRDYHEDFDTALNNIRNGAFGDWVVMMRIVKLQKSKEIWNRKLRLHLLVINHFKPSEIFNPNEAIHTKQTKRRLRMKK